MVEVPTETMAPAVEAVVAPERQALDLANKFLESPEAKTIQAQEFMSSQMDSTLAMASSDNTLFHIESSYASGSTNQDAKKTVISWLTTGENKGDLPGGSIEVLEDANEVSIFAYKLDKPSITDQGYRNGYSVDVVDRTNEMFARGQQIELTNEQVQEILGRLGAAKVDSGATETTARALDARYRMSEAIVNFQNVERSSPFGRRFRKRRAISRLEKALKAYSEFWPPLQDDEEEKKKKMKKKMINDTKRENVVLNQKLQPQPI